MAEVSKRPAGIKTREAILDASRQLFLRQGFHATGMREVARETGISLGAVYNHFVSKEEILQELLTQRNLYAAVSEGFAHAMGETAECLLRSGFTEVMSRAKEITDFPRLLFIDFVEFQGRHVAALISQVVPEFVVFFERVHQLGLRTGEMRAASPLLLARSYMGTVLSSFILEFVAVKMFPDASKLPLRVDNWEEGMMDILLHGVLKESHKREGD